MKEQLEQSIAAAGLTEAEAADVRQQYHVQINLTDSQRQEIAGIAHQSLRAVHAVISGRG